MNLQKQNNLSNPTTPKRKRLGTGRLIRRDARKVSVIANSTPVSQQVASSVPEVPGSQSPALPCNQIEYLRDHSNSSVSSFIPCSPGTEDDLTNWNSLIAGTNKRNNKSVSDQVSEEVSEEMFLSKLELELTQKDLDVKTKETTLKQEIDNSFELVNQSIVNGNIEKDTSLFETKDSFLLDIQTCDIAESKQSKEKDRIESRVLQNNSDNFYGLPLITKGLFKSFRNIEKFYEWQEECLNLDAIKERRNLIYALPTSGGKTLVAEVLMLREVLNRKKNALFILPFVSIVQEKIWALSPFALRLEFLVEEYAGGKGLLPPKKRRKKNSIYIATIEKGLALIRSLIELDRLEEIGLIVVDELHLIGEPGRGGTLEILLTTVLFANKGIQIVGMSATIGNLPELARYLRAEVFERMFRPVQLEEYVKLGDMLHRLVHGPEGLEVVPHRQLNYDYTAAAARLDPDRVGGLVAEVVPATSCLVFCPTKRNCENVANLLATMQRREMISHLPAERAALAAALRREGAAAALARGARRGVAYHHAGLAADERAMLEQAFRSGVISVLCCTSTLAAGVNLPAGRVVIRAPRVGRAFLSLAAYRQMIGRAGRAGVCDTGESIIICSGGEWPQLRGVLCGGVCAARSQVGAGAGVPALLLSGVALRLAASRRALAALLARTLLATAATTADTADTADTGPIDIAQLCDDTIRSLLESKVLEVAEEPQGSKGDGDNCSFDSDTPLRVSALGKAAIKGCMEVSTARQLLQDLDVASRGLVLLSSLHLLYLVTPHDAAGIKPDYRHYYSLYCNLDEDSLHTAKVLGITEQNAIRMMTGKPITNVPEVVLCRFYLALMLHDLWNEVPFHVVADKYVIARGTVQAVMCGAAAFAAGAARACGELGRWAPRALLEQVGPRLRHAAAPHLHRLMDLPAVGKARALQLSRAGYKGIEDLAKASPEDLTSSVAHLSRNAANHLISAARLMLIEKVENLRAEAEEVMDELNV